MLANQTLKKMYFNFGFLSPLPLKKTHNLNLSPGLSSTTFQKAATKKKLKFPNIGRSLLNLNPRKY